MIDFFKQGDHLVMRYVPERGNDDWLVRPLESEDDIPLSGGTLHVRREIYRSDFEDSEFAMDPCYHFVVGILEAGYYRMGSSQKTENKAR